MKALILFIVFSLVTFIGVLGPSTLGELGFDSVSVYAATGDRASGRTSGKKSEQKKKTRRVPTISESIFKKLGTAQEFMDAKDYVSAEQFLQDMLNRSKKYNGNELGNIHNMIGYIAFLKEDYKGAIYSYEQVLAQGEDVTEGLEVTTLYTIAQLSFVVENYQDALDYMETWISKAENPGPEPRIFMGQVYYQMKDYPNALKQIQQGISIAQERGTKVKENWWALVAFLFYEKEDFQGYTDTMKILVKEFPKRDYWIRLAGIYGQEGQEQLQLNTLQAAYAGDYFESKTDFTNLAGLPANTELGGTFFVTTAPAPIILFSPIVTPLQTIALSPIHTLSLSTTGLVFPTGSDLSYIPCQSASEIYAPCANIQASPIVICSAAIILTPGVIRTYLPISSFPSQVSIFQVVN